MVITRAEGLKGELQIPGDKSISHRSVMLGALAKGVTEIQNFLTGADCLSTISCFRQMGITIEQNDTSVLVHGRGLHGLETPGGILDCGNSGTTTRLLSGILSGQVFESTITGDESIQKRPMQRIMEPLSSMGAKIACENEQGFAPMHFFPSTLQGIDYHTPMASAQVKSAILLAGLYAEGKTSVIEPHLSRNHTEIMINYFGGDVSSLGNRCTLRPVSNLYARTLMVPGDISSAAYFLVAALLVPNSEILLRNVGMNPTRTGILTVLKNMGADITYQNRNHEQGEESADILVKSSSLHGTVIEGALIPTLIDEIPIIAVAAAYATGKTVIRDAAELKFKECNRIDAIAKGLSSMNVDIEPTEDGMIIHGGRELHGASIDCFRDHRIAMSFAIAGLCANGDTKIEDDACITISYPNFYSDLFSFLD